MPVSAKLVPDRGALFGGEWQPRGVRTETSGAGSEVEYIEQRMSRKTVLFRRFYQWRFEDTVSSGHHFRSGANIATSTFVTQVKDVFKFGRIPLVSIRPYKSNPPEAWYLWSTFPSGAEDAHIDLIAEHIRQVQNHAEVPRGARMFMCFGLEPKADVTAGKGTPAEYAAAFRHFRDRLEITNGIRNLVWTVIHSGFTFQVDSFATVDQYWPGDSYVDWVGNDPYNTPNVNLQPWRSMAVEQGYCQEWAASRVPGKPVLIGEFGTMESSWSLNALTISSVNTTTDTLTASAPPKFDIGRLVRFSATTMPGGLTAGVDYYVHSLPNGTRGNTFKVSATLGGGPVDITSAGSAVTVTTVPGAVADGQDRADWYTDAGVYFEATPSLKGITKYNKNVLPGGMWWYDEDADTTNVTALSRDAFHALAQRPHLHPSLAEAPDFCGIAARG